MEKLRIALPNGEMKKDVVSFMKDVGFDINPTERGLLIPVADMPLEFVILRASDVPKVVRDERSEIKAGITGSDILWESGEGSDAGSEIPIYEYNQNAKKSSLYFGVTEDFMDFIYEKEEREFYAGDLSSMMVASKYVNITSEYLETRTIQGMEILNVPGSDEAMQYAYPLCVAVVGIRSSGETQRANNIQVVESFHDVTMRMIQEASKLSSSDARVLEDFQEKMERGVLLSRPLTTALL